LQLETARNSSDVDDVTLTDDQVAVIDRKKSAIRVIHPASTVA
jgi:hypothetical protein